MTRTAFLSTKRFNLLLTGLVILLTSSMSFAEHNHQAGMEMPAKMTKSSSCQGVDIHCAKTVTSAFAPNGDLWRLWVIEKSLYAQISTDNGKHFLAAKKVAIPAEKISARNENRPKIAFDNASGVYLSWSTPREKKYTADVRFSYSSDYGKTFTKPITVNNDNLLAGHSFDELLVTPEGDISVVWLDSRVAHKLRKQGKKTNGSALFLAKANFLKGETTFSNTQLANNTCVCCRIAMTFNKQGKLTILWRHIYGDNIREFALMTLDKKNPTPIQISHDHWKINGCPHQGGGISIDENNTYHLVWFNQGDKGKGIFYAQSSDQGNTLTTPLSVGNLSAQAAHAHVMQSGNTVDIVWTEFNGEVHQLMHQRSVDNGKSFGVATQIAQSNSGSDRPFIIKKSGKHFVSWHGGKQGHWFKQL